MASVDLILEGGIGYALLLAIGFLWLVTVIAGLDVCVHLSLDMSLGFSHAPNLRTQL
jgi:hypothetical protein